ncbi:MAG: hypothetical protein DIU81_006845 [[Clostridium] cellulosi]
MLIPYTSIHPTRIVFYALSDQRSRQSYKQTFTGAQVRQAQSGLLSPAARKRLNLAINTLSYLSEWKTVYSKADDKTFRFKMNFVTLTLPAATSLSDSQVVGKVLSEFLRRWRKRDVQLLYVWKAEVQDNGRLHFHLTTNRFIHYKKLRFYWNKACAKAGIRHPELYLEANSTDVHSVKGVKNIAAYLIAYISKKDLYQKPLKRYFKRYGRQLRELAAPAFQLPKNYFARLKRRPTCSIWGASKCLLDSKLNDVFEHTRVGNQLNAYLNHKEADYQDDFCAVYRMNKVLFNKMTEVSAEWRSFINTKRRLEADNTQRYFVI